MEGVKGYFDHEDVPGENEWGAIIKDEEIFATELVTCIGQQIGIIVAETEAQARLATKAVKVEYEELPGAVYSCEEAIAANSYIEVSCHSLPEQGHWLESNKGSLKKVDLSFTYTLSRQVFKGTLLGDEAQQ